MAESHRLLLWPAWLACALVSLTGCPNHGFSEIREDILLPSCGLSNSCHTGGAGDFDLSDSADAYGQLVNFESIDNPGAIRVVPFDSEASYLIAKLRADDDIVGDEMPPNRDLALNDPEKFQIIVDWIDAGALND